MHMLERYGFDEQAAPLGACLLKRSLRPRSLAWTGQESATTWMRRIDIDRRTHRQTQRHLAAQTNIDSPCMRRIDHLSQ
jgi:hypothetical protein